MSIISSSADSVTSQASWQNRVAENFSLTDGLPLGLTVTSANVLRAIS
jgi:hypothetical protein